MVASRSRQLRRERQQIKRRRSQREAEARETHARQARAALHKDFSRQRRRRAISCMLFILAGVMAVYHLFEHLDVVPPMTGSSGLDDLVVGWPLAGLLGITGAIMYADSWQSA